MTKKKIIVVGAGVAGLAAAIRLANDGFEVEIFEKYIRPGGKMNRVEADGFTFDVGPTIVMMPEVYEEVFRVAGREPSEYIPMEKLDPIYRVQFADGESVDVSTDLVEFTKFLESISPEAAKGYFAYLADIYERYLIAKDHFIEKAFRGPADFYNPATLYQALKLKTFDSAHQNIAKFVKDDKLQKLLSFQTLYIGISPYKGPSIYTIIPMIEMIYGVWFMPGGMYRMTQGMTRLAEELGVRINLESEVEEILIENKTAKGVRVRGEDFWADAVLCNADFPQAMHKLISKESDKGKYTSAKIDKMDYSCSCMLLYLGINKKLDSLEMHNIHFARDFDRNIADIFEGRLPQDPSIYLYVASRLDPTLAPEGKEALYVLVPVPSLAHGYSDWGEEAINRYKEIVFRKIEGIEGLEDLRADIVSETIYTPRDFEERFSAYKGATFGLAPTLMQSNYFRPHNKADFCENFYFAGSSVHPGAGVPIVLTSAKLAAAEIIKDLGKTDA